MIHILLIQAIVKAASFAAYSVALRFTGDAGFATGLHNGEIEDQAYERIN